MDGDGDDNNVHICSHILSRRSTALRLKLSMILVKLESSIR